MFWRSLKGAAVGAIITTIIVIVILSLLFGINFLMVESPIDRAQDLEQFQKDLPIGALAGIIVGIFSGIASKLPRHGVRIIPSIIVVASCALVVRFITIIPPHYIGTPRPSYIPTIIAVFVGSMLVLVYGIIITKRKEKEQNGKN